MQKIKLNIYFILLSIILSMGIGSCTPKTKPINLGTDVCEHCKMTIVDAKWGSEILTTKSKVLKFDVVECMIAYYLQNPDLQKSVHSLWTINYLNPGEFINAREAVYVRSRYFHSPMGLNAVSLKSKSDIAGLGVEEDLKPFNWDYLITLVKKEIPGTN